MTCEYAKQNNIKVKGIILNNFNSNNIVHIDNKISIEKLTKIDVIATTSHNSNKISIDNIEDIFEELE